MGLCHLILANLLNCTFPKALSDWLLFEILKFDKIPSPKNLASTVALDIERVTLDGWFADRTLNVNAGAAPVLTTAEQSNAIWVITLLLAETV